MSKTVIQKESLSNSACFIIGELIDAGFLKVQKLKSGRVLYEATVEPVRAEKPATEAPKPPPKSDDDKFMTKQVSSRTFTMIELFKKHRGYRMADSWIKMKPQREASNAILGILRPEQVEKLLMAYDEIKAHDKFYGDYSNPHNMLSKLDKVIEIYRTIKAKDYKPKETKQSEYDIVKNITKYNEGKEEYEELK